jgi:hypothetical protein
MAKKTKTPKIKLSPGSNSDRAVATLSFHSAHRLASSLSAWKDEIDARRASGEEDAHYQSLVYETIRTEARHLAQWCKLQNVVQGTDYFDCILEDLIDLIERLGIHGMLGFIDKTK